MNLASSSSALKIHTWPDGELLHTYSPHVNNAGVIKSISWGKDGSWMAVVPANGPTEIITIKDSIKRLCTIKDIEKPTCVAFQNNTKKNIALANNAGQVLLYDMKAKSIKKVFPGVTSNIFYLEYTAKDSHLVAACENGELLVYSNMTFGLTNRFTIPKSTRITSARCHPSKRNFLTAGSREGYVAIWDVNLNKVKFLTKAHNAAVSGIAFSPLSCTLIITLGLDRQFCFFDSNSNKCVAQIPVDNNLTAVDYSPEGIHVTVASQDGRIFIYDTRMIRTPEKVIIAHESQINQLFFKKTSPDDSFANVIYEEISENSPCQNKSSTLESFAMYSDIIMPPTQCSSNTNNNPSEIGDSFMEAIGLNSPFQNAPAKQDSVLGVTDSVKKWMHKRPPPTIATPNNAEVSQPTDLIGVKPPTSTPKYLTDENGQVLSPILSFNQTVPTTFTNNNGTNSIDLQKIIRETVKEVVTEELGKFKKQMQYELFEVSTNLRRNFLDLQMSIVKEFVQVESNLEKIKEALPLEDSQEEALLEENYRLRTELSLLREKINHRL